MTRPCPGPIPPSKPRLEAPPGACDTHVHLFGPYDRFPLSDNRGYTPPEAPLEMLEALMGTLGIERAVIVHGSAHGTDLRVTVDALERLGERGRGVSVIRPDIDEHRLRELDRVGFRGARMSTVLKGGVGIEHLDALVRRIAPLGWHVQIHMNGPVQMADIAPRLRGLPVPVVIDGMGSFKPVHGVDHPGFRMLLDLVEREDCWVKMIAINRQSEQGAPFADVAPFARALMRLRPDRLLWGSDWPHVMLWDQPMPDDADLLDWLLECGADQAALRAILVDNPARLYGFRPA